MNHKVRCWCVESVAEGEYEFKDLSRVDAIERAADQFREDCCSSAAMYVPPRHRIQTEVIEVRP